MIQITKNKYNLVFTLSAAVAATLLLGAVYVYANPIILQQSAKFPGTATTTRATLTPGTGTTTSNTFNAYQRVQGTAGGDNTIPKEAHLAVQFTASSTNSTLAYRFEYSQDNRDWYAESDVITLNATSTNIIQTYKEYVWRFASSTGGTSDDTKSLKIIDVPIKAQYARVVFYAPQWAAFPYSPTTTASHNLGLWTEFIPFKETN